RERGLLALLGLLLDSFLAFEARFAGATAVVERLGEHPAADDDCPGHRTRRHAGDRGADERLRHRAALDQLLRLALADHRAEQTAFHRVAQQLPAGAQRDVGQDQVSHRVGTGRRHLAGRVLRVADRVFDRLCQLAASCHAVSVTGRSVRPYFLRPKSIVTTFDPSSPPSTPPSLPCSGSLAGLSFPASSCGSSASSSPTAWNWRPKSTAGSTKAVIAENGTTKVVGIWLKVRPTVNPSSLTRRSQNLFCKTMVISSGKRSLRCAGTCTSGAPVLKVM